MTVQYFTKPEYIGSDPTTLLQGGKVVARGLIPQIETRPALSFDAPLQIGVEVTITRSQWEGGVYAPVETLTVDEVDVIGDITDNMDGTWTYTAASPGRLRYMAHPAVGAPAGKAAIIGVALPVNTAPPVIEVTGNAYEVTAGSWTGADSVNITVLKDGDPASMSGTFTAADDGLTLEVIETATNDQGTADPVTVSHVIEYVSDPPVVVTPASITWTGNSWEITPTAYSGPGLSITEGAVLGGDPVGLTGTITAADDGKLLTYTSEASNIDGTVTDSVSEAADYVPALPVNITPPTIDITGNSYAVGIGDWSGEDSINTVVTLGGDPAGLTGTITAADDGKTLLVSETATNAAGTSSPVEVSEVVSYVAPSTIDGFYGVGAGQIPSDWRFDDPTVSGSAVTGVRNDGGALTAYALTVASGEEPVAATNYISIADGTDKLSIANPVDLGGVHIFMPLRIVGNSGSNRFPSPLSFGGSSNERILLNLPSGIVRLISTTAGIDFTLSIGAITTGSWELFEFRFADGTFDVYRDGALAAQQTGVSGSIYLNTIAGTVSSNWLNADIGRSIGLITNGGGEAAIPVIRSTLASEYGITLA